MKAARVAYLSFCGCCAVLLALWVAIAFPPKLAEFQKNEVRRDELEKENRRFKTEANALRRNQDRFLSDKWFVQKVAHETGYAHEGEIIFEFVEEQIEEDGNDDTK